MKFCPKCKMTVDAHCECPVCHNNLTNEPYTADEGEVYVFNKYLIPYLLRVHYFPIVCALVVIIRIILTFSTINWYCLLALFLVFLSLLESLFKNRISAIESWMFSEDYSNIRCTIAKYGAGILGVLVSFLFW